MSNWNDIIAAHATGTLSYTFPPSNNATIKCYARLLSDDYTGQAIYRLSDATGTHYVQLEGQTSNTMQLVEYPEASALITDIPVLHNTWQMLVLVVTLTQVHVYQNGVLINSGFLADPLQVASMAFYNEVSQLYDELVHIPAAVSTEQIERWQEQEWPVVTADPGGSYEEQYALGTLAEPTGTWSSSPPVVGDGEYLWMRKRWVEGDGTPGDWSTAVRIKGDRGASSVGLGVKVNYSAFGTANPGEVYLHGFTDAGLPADVDGFIYFQDEKLTVNKRMVNPDVPIDGYLVLERSTGDGYVSSYDYLTNQFVIRDGSFGKDGYIIDEIGWVFIGRMYNIQAEHTQSALIYDRAKSLSEARDEVLRDVIFKKTNITQEEFNSLINFTGTEFFQRLAVSTLFVNDLIGNDAFLQQLFAKHIELQSGGVIYSGYSVEGEPPADEAGFWLHASGKFKAKNADLLGRLKTGAGASDQAKVAIQDESGITHVAFDGQGNDDLFFSQEGATAGQFEVQITTKDHAVPYQVWEETTLFQVGDTGPGGGVIFYDKGNWNNGWRYLECSQDHLGDNFAQWASQDTDITGLGSAMGSGDANTQTIVGSLGSNAPAAHLCSTLTQGGKSDWFLPNVLELKAIYDNKHLISGLHDTGQLYEMRYAASEQVYSFNARFVYMHTGNNYSSRKHALYRVRAIRKVAENECWSYVTYYTYHDRFAWRETSASWSSETTIQPGSTYPLAGYGITIGFGGVAGHEVGDLWSFEQGDMYALSVRDNQGKEYVKLSAGKFHTPIIAFEKDTQLAFYAYGEGADVRVMTVRHDWGENNVPGVRLDTTLDRTTTADPNLNIDTTYSNVRFSTSSIQFKKDVETAEKPCYRKVLDLRAVWFRSTCSADDFGDTWSHWGFIAEEVAEVDPRLCHFSYDVDESEQPLLDKDGKPKNLQVRGVQWGRITALLQAVVKDHDAQIQELEARCQALEQVNQDLLERLAALEIAVFPDSN